MGVRSELRAGQFMSIFWKSIFGGEFQELLAEMLETCDRCSFPLQPFRIHWLNRTFFFAPIANDRHIELLSIIRTVSFSNHGSALNIIKANEYFYAFWSIHGVTMRLTERQMPPTRPSTFSTAQENLTDVQITVFSTAMQKISARERLQRK